MALPSENDFVRKVSSEKEPHLTLLYLGDNQFDSAELGLVTGYVEHAASLLSPFMISVKKRGELGDKKADVLFFDDVWSKNLLEFRSQLLKNDLISRAYLSVDQFSEWTPHLTLGYPETPAKPDPREDPGFWYINFDRIALWTSDYEGPTFELSHKDSDMEVAMSQIERGRSTVGGILSHYGIKGMKWGVRRSDAEIARASSTTAEAPSRPAPKVSDDVKSAMSSQRKIAEGGTQTLSNQELQGLLTRMNLERQYRQMTAAPPGSPPKSAMDKGLGAVNKALAVGVTVEKVRKFLDTPTGKAVKTGVGTALSAGVAYATGGTSAAVAAGAGAVSRGLTRDRGSSDLERERE